MKALSSTALLLLFTLALSTLLPTTASAQADATVEAARERFNEGVEYFDNNEYERARLAFVQAYALKPHPAILLNLAQSELRSGHETAAATHFARYLREHSEATSEQREAAKEGLEKAQDSVGVVTLLVDPSGAELTVDGEAAGRTPLDDPLYLSPGEHSIVAQKGGETARLNVTVSAGDKINRSLTIGKAPAAAAPSTSEDETPVNDEAEADEPEAEQETESIEFDSGEGDRQSFPAWFADTPGAWVGAGLTVAGLVAGGAFLVSKNNYYAAAEEVGDEIKSEAAKVPHPTQGICNAPWGQPRPSTLSAGEQWVYDPDPGFKDACDKLKDREEAGDRYRTLSTVSFAVAGVAAAGTIVYYLIDAPTVGEVSRQNGPRAARRNLKPQLVPVFGPDQAGLLLQGQF
jgi:hypothetical protein